MAYSDQEIADFIKANIDNPQLIAEKARESGVSTGDLARAGNYSLGQVNDYFSSAGVANTPLSVNDKEINDYFAANMGSPTNVVGKMNQYGVTASDLARATGYTGDISNINNYIARGTPRTLAPLLNAWGQTEEGNQTWVDPTLPSNGNFYTRKWDDSTGNWTQTPNFDTNIWEMDSGEGGSTLRQKAFDPYAYGQRVTVGGRDAIYSPYDMGDLGGRQAGLRYSGNASSKEFGQSGDISGYLYDPRAYAAWVASTNKGGDFITKALDSGMGVMAPGMAFTGMALSGALAPFTQGGMGTLAAGDASAIAAGEAAQAAGGDAFIGALDPWSAGAFAQTAGLSFAPSWTLADNPFTNWMEKKVTNPTTYVNQGLKLAGGDNATNNAISRGVNAAAGAVGSNTLTNGSAINSSSTSGGSTALTTGSGATSSGSGSLATGAGASVVAGAGTGALSTNGNTGNNMSTIDDFTGAVNTVGNAVNTAGNWIGNGVSSAGNWLTGSNQSGIPNWILPAVGAGITTDYFNRPDLTGYAKDALERNKAMPTTYTPFDPGNYVSNLQESGTLDKFISPNVKNINEAVAQQRQAASARAAMNGQDLWGTGAGAVPNREDINNSLIDLQQNRAISEATSSALNPLVNLGAQQYQFANGQYPFLRDASTASLLNATKSYDRGSLAAQFAGLGMAWAAMNRNGGLFNNGGNNGGGTRPPGTNPPGPNNPGPNNPPGVFTPPGGYNGSIMPNNMPWYVNNPDGSVSIDWGKYFNTGPGSDGYFGDMTFDSNGNFTGVDMPGAGGFTLDADGNPIAFNNSNFGNPDNITGTSLDLNYGTNPFLNGSAGQTDLFGNYINNAGLDWNIPGNDLASGYDWSNWSDADFSDFGSPDWLDW